MDCPICTGVSIFVFDSPYKKRVFQCSSIKCQHLFVEGYDVDVGVCDRGENTSVNKLRADRNRRIDLYGKRNELIFSKVSEKLKLSRTEPIKILDFGAGDGNLVSSFKKIHPHSIITCIEPHEVFKELLYEVADNVVTTTAELSDDYDLIILNEVIEHLNHPVEELRRLSKLLKGNNSAVFIATPLGMTHRMLYDTSAYDTNSHLHFFTRTSLNLCCINSGLTAIDIDDCNQPIYSTITTNVFLPKLKKKLLNFILCRLLNVFSKRYILPKEHISGLCFKNEK